jgi:hypothetical protein
VLNYYKAPTRINRNIDDEFGSTEGAPAPIRDISGVNSQRGKNKSVDFGRSGKSGLKSETTDPTKGGVKEIDN